MIELIPEDIKDRVNFRTEVKSSTETEYPAQKTPMGSKHIVFVMLWAPTDDHAALSAQGNIDVYGRTDYAMEMGTTTKGANDRDKKSVEHHQSPRSIVPMSTWCKPGLKV